MPKIIILRESHLKKIINDIVSEQISQVPKQADNATERQQNINNTWCSTVNGVINNPQHYMNGKKFEDYKKSNRVTYDEWSKAAQSCPKHRENWASIPAELKDKEGVKAFQDWLDANKPGWAEGYSGGKLNKKPGYGTYGPRTSKAWRLHKPTYLVNKAETVGAKYNYTPRIDAELAYIIKRKLTDKQFFIYDPKFNLLYLFDVGGKYVLHTHVIDGADEQKSQDSTSVSYTMSDWCKSSPVPGEDAKGQKLGDTPVHCTATNFTTKESCEKINKPNQKKTRTWDEEKGICIADPAYYIISAAKDAFLKKGIYHISSLSFYPGYTGKGLNIFNMTDTKGQKLAPAIHGIPNIAQRLTASEDLRKVLNADLSNGKVPKEYLNSIKLIANANQSFGCIGVPAKFIENPMVQKLAKGARVFALGDTGTSYLVQNSESYFEKLGGDGETCQNPIMVARQMSGNQDLSNLAESIINESIKKVLSNVLSNFQAEANVEDDMVMQFRVKGLNKYINGKVGMTIEDPTTKKDLIVLNFQGPIRDVQTDKVVYNRSEFKNINKNNYEQIARTYKIKMVST